MSSWQPVMCREASSFTSSHTDPHQVDLLHEPCPRSRLSFHTSQQNSITLRALSGLSAQRFGPLTVRVVAALGPFRVTRANERRMFGEIRRSLDSLAQHGFAAARSAMGEARES